MAKQTSDRQKSSNGFQTFLFVFLIPAVVLLIIVSVILYVLGINPLHTIRSASSDLPIISSWIDGEEEDEMELTEPDEDAAITIQELEQQLASAEATIEDLEEELNQYEVDAEFEAGSATGSEEADPNEELRRIARVYENMNPRQAAEIMSELDDEDLILHMTEISDDARSQIIQNIEAERAAQIMTLLTN